VLVSAVSSSLKLDGISVTDLDDMYSPCGTGKKKKDEITCYPILQKNNTKVQPKRRKKKRKKETKKWATDL
jgi:hypothetical protein